MAEKLYTVFTLELEGGKYYVGRSESVDRRLREHYAGEGTEFTKLHRPLAEQQVEKVSCKSKDEATAVVAKRTLELMSEKGIENVRGSQHSRINLGEKTKKALQHEIDVLKNNCYECHEPGHMAQSCKKKKRSKSRSSKPYSSSSRHGSRGVSGGACFRCGRASHWQGQCYASWSIDGKPLR